MGAAATDRDRASQSPVGPRADHLAGLQQTRAVCRYLPLIPVVAAVAVGMAVDRFLDPALGVWAALAPGLFIAWLAAWLTYWQRVANVALACTLAATGGCWHHLSWNCFPADDLGGYATDVSEPVALEVTALARPRIVAAGEFDPLTSFASGDYSRLEVRIERLRQRDQWISCSGTAPMVVQGHLLGVHAGDRLRVFAEIVAASPAMNPGEFDFAEHARGDRRRAQLRAGFPECVERISAGSRLRPAFWLAEVRAAGERTLARYVRPEQTDLAAALLLGNRGGLDDERLQPFLQTGTVHVLSISGLHVGMLAAALFAGLRLGLLPRRSALWAVALIVAAYCVLTEARPPVLRATILVVLYCASLGLRRPAAGFNTLAAAALVVLALNPADLFRTGPQLSFLSVAALLAMATAIERWMEPDELDRLIDLARSPVERVLRSAGRWALRAMLLSAAIWLATGPLVMREFHIFSPLAPLINVVVWLPVAVALLSGFLVLLLGWLFPPAAGMAGWICGGSLGLLDWLVESAAALPGSHAWVAGPAAWWLLGLYGGWAAWGLLGRFYLPRRWTMTLAAGWVAVGFSAPLLDREPTTLRTTFLSVGHGLAVVVELPDGRTLLYDAGRLGNPRAASAAVAGYLWSRGITHLDAVVVSHSDVDHYNGLPGVLERFTVGSVYVSPVFDEDRSPAVEALRTAIDTAGVNLRTVVQGDRLDGGPGVEILVLHPPELGVVGSDNANSIVLAIEHQGQRLLLTGDLESPGLDDVLAELDWNCDLLLAPHHGSPRSDPVGLARWCQPEWVIASTSASRDVQSTAVGYADAGAEMLVTGRTGAVTATIRAGRMQVESWRP